MSSALLRVQDELSPGSAPPELRELMEATSTADAPYDNVRVAVSNYVLALRNASAAPEQVLSSITYMLRGDARPSLELDARRAMVVRWFIEEYYRPTRARRAG